MVAPDTLGQAEEKEFDDLSANQQLGILVVAIFSGLALGGLLADPQVGISDETIESAWKAGDKMGVEFMRRVKEKANGR